MVMSPITIRSGGQSGVDRAALDFAIARDWPYVGWCPAGGWAEDIPTPPGVLTKYPGLIATPTAVLEQRTAWNVRDSQATIILVSKDESMRQPGVTFTWLSAGVIFCRPHRAVIMADEAALTSAREWLTALVEESKDAEFILNVAGPPESAAPGIYDHASRYLARLLG